MNVYVAGRTTDYERVRWFQALARECGHNVTYDWTRAIPDEDWEKGEGSLNLDKAFQRSCAFMDMQGVRKADVVIVVCGTQLCGTLIEIGAALVQGKLVWLFGQPERESVFFEMNQVRRFDNEDEIRLALERAGA